MLHTGRGPVPVTSASGVVPMKPRIASSKSCRLANGSVFVNSALAFNVAGSGPFGAIWPCAAEQLTAIKTAIAAAHNAEKFGAEIGYVVRFDSDAIKSMAITVLINMNEGSRRWAN